jgi:hypothetical protein
MAAKIEHITKKYTRSINFNSFTTELQASVIVNSVEELIAESEKLFKQAKALTDMDIRKAEEENKTSTGA